MKTMVVPGKIESLPAIAQYVLQAACLAQLNEQAAYRLRLAVDEIAVNIITHGYTTAVGEGFSPVGEGSSPIGEGSSPVGEGSSLVGEGSSPVGEGSLALSAVLEESRLLIYLEDTGQHFDPCQMPPPDLRTPPESRPPGGLGIYLARWGVDQVQYERLPNRNRTTFVVQRCRRQQPEQDTPQS